MTADDLPASLGFVETYDQTAMRELAEEALRENGAARELCGLYAGQAQNEIDRNLERHPAAFAKLGVSIRMGFTFRDAGLDEVWRERLSEDMEMARQYGRDDVVAVLSEALLVSTIQALKALGLDQDWFRQKAVQEAWSAGIDEPEAWLKARGLW